MATEAQIRVICETCLAIVLTTADPWLLYISCLFVSIYAIGISGKNTSCLSAFVAMSQLCKTNPINEKPK